MPQIFLFFLSSILLMGCTAGSSSIQNKFNTDPQIILEKSWQWESTITPVNKILVNTPENYTLLLTANGLAQIRFDCNRGSGDFNISQGKLSTRMACPPGSLGSHFARDLQRVVSFFTMDNRLYLELPYDSGTMKFHLAAID